MLKKYEENENFYHQGYIITLSLGIVFTIFFGSKYLKIQNEIGHSLNGLCNNCGPDSVNGSVWFWSKIKGAGMGINDAHLSMTSFILGAVSLFWVILCIGTIFFWLKNYHISKNKKKSSS